MTFSSASLEIRGSSRLERSLGFLVSHWLKSSQLIPHWAAIGPEGRSVLIGKLVRELSIQRSLAY